MQADRTAVEAAVLPVDKPSGMTSRQLVDWVQQQFPDCKVGHGGTLDRLARGVLPIFLGKATGLVRYFHHQPKIYRTSIRFDQTSPTFDLDGTVETVDPGVAPPIKDLQEWLTDQRGVIDQKPPIYSAVKLRGERVSDRVRRGEKVVLESRPVRVEKVILLASSFPRIEVEIHCGKGFYVRSFARDLAEQFALGGAVVTELIREKYGPFTRSDAVQYGSQLKLSRKQLSSPLRAIGHLAELRVTDQQLRLISHGTAIARTFDHPDGTSVAVVDDRNRLVGVARAVSRDGRDLWQPEKIMVTV